MKPINELDEFWTGCHDGFYQLGMDEKGNEFAKAIDCGRPWCDNPGCRERTEARRFSRCLERGLKIDRMGHLVLTYPRRPFDLRPWTGEEIKKEVEALAGAFEMWGITDFMIKLHPQGEKHPDVYAPHYDCILRMDGVNMDDIGLACFMDTIRYQMRLPLKTPENEAYQIPILMIDGEIKFFDFKYASQIKYEYSDTPEMKTHWLKYMNKNTFLNPQVNLGLARNWGSVQTFFSRGAIRLYNRYKQEWGFNKKGKLYEKYTVGWRGEAVWSLKDLEDVKPEDMRIYGYVANILNNTSPLTGEKITWYGKPVRSDKLEDMGFEKIWNGVYQRNPPKEVLFRYETMKVVEGALMNNKSPPEEACVGGVA